MFAVVDTAEFPPLAEVLEAQQAGRDFDVVTRCGIEYDGALSDSPHALVDIAFTERDFAIEVVIEVDSSRRSLLELVRTRAFMLMDPDRARALQSVPTDEAVQTGTSLTVSIDDVQAIMSILEQRVELPMPVYEPTIIDLREESDDTVARNFLRDAHAPTAVAIHYRDDGAPALLIADGDLPPAPEGYDLDHPLQGRWGAMAGAGKSVLRLDVFSAEGRFRSWLIPQPSPELVRAGASGAHQILLLKGPLKSQESITQDQRDAGVHVWVENVESFRHLLAELDS